MIEERTIRLLLVDSDKNNQLAFEKYVNDMQLPYEYEIVDSITRAENIIKHVYIDVVVSDFLLCDGASFELFCQFSEIPLIVMIEAGNVNVADEVLKMGACDYLVKDSDGDYLKTLPLTIELARKHKKNEKELQNYQERLHSMLDERTEELQQSFSRERSLRYIIENSLNEIFIFDAENYRFLFANRGARKNTGYSKSELIKMTPWDIKDEYDPFSFERILAQIVEETQDRVIFETIHRRKDGSTYPIEVYIEKTHYNNRPAFVEIILDISKRKEVEKTYREMVEGSSDLIVKLDSEANIHYINNMAREITGYYPDQLIGQSGFQFVHPDDLEKTQAWYNNFVKQELPSGTIETRLVNQESGEINDLLWTVNFYHKRNDKNSYAYGIARDITKRKKVEEAIRKSEEQWNRTFHSFTDIVMVLDVDLHIVKINQAGCDTIGHLCDEITGQYCYELLNCSKKSCDDCPVLRIKSTLLPSTQEVYYKALDKSFLVSASPVFDEEGEIELIAIVAKDLTEKKQLEQQLLHAQKMEAIGTLAGGIAHDFNNILSTILGYAELIKDDVVTGSDTEKDISEIIDSAKKGAELVRQILTFSRETNMEKKPVRPQLIVQDAIKLLKCTMPESISLEKEVDPDCGLVFMNPVNLYQIVVNLCCNSQQAMTDQKGIVRISLKQREYANGKKYGPREVPPGSYIVLSVSDNGCGMEQEVVNRIFEPYFSTKEENEGMGMGLATVYGIVHDADGYIRVKSIPGKGSTFTICLPEFQKNESLKQDIETLPHDRSGGENILIVDDEPILLRATKRHLESNGYKVTAISDGKEALETIRLNPEKFDLLITDQTMPKLSGIDLAAAVKESHPDLPVIICTGHCDQLIREKALKMGIKKFVMKPISRNELIAAIRSVFDG